MNILCALLQWTKIFLNSIASGFVTQNEILPEILETKIEKYFIATFTIQITCYYEINWNSFDRWTINWSVCEEHMIRNRYLNVKIPFSLNFSTITSKCCCCCHRSIGFMYCDTIIVLKMLYLLRAFSVMMKSEVESTFNQ